MKLEMSNCITITVTNYKHVASQPVTDVHSLLVNSIELAEQLDKNLENTKISSRIGFSIHTKNSFNSSLKKNWGYVVNFIMQNISQKPK